MTRAINTASLPPEYADPPSEDGVFLLLLPHAIISNVSNIQQTIKKGTRIGQLIIAPVVIADFVLETGKKRGTDAFGSTGE